MFMQLNNQSCVTGSDRDTVFTKDDLKKTETVQIFSSFLLMDLVAVPNHAISACVSYILHCKIKT